MRKIVVPADGRVSVGAVRDAIAGMAESDVIDVAVEFPIAPSALAVVTDGSYELKGKKRK